MPAQTTYGFFYPPRTTGESSSAGTSTAGAGPSTSMPQFGTYTGGARYSGPAYNFYGADFFSTGQRDPDAGDGEPSSFNPMDEEP